MGEGFGAIKLHEVSEPVIAAARAAVPKSAALLLDVNCEWSVAEAIAIGKRLAPLGLEWFEEPVFPPEDGAGLRAVGEACGIPIAAGENCCFATQFAALFDARAVQYAQPSVTKVGGVTEFRSDRGACRAARREARAALAVLRARRARDAAPDCRAGAGRAFRILLSSGRRLAVRRSAAPARELDCRRAGPGADLIRRYDVTRR